MCRNTKNVIMQHQSNIYCIQTILKPVTTLKAKFLKMDSLSESRKMGELNMFHNSLRVVEKRCLLSLASCFQKGLSCT